MAEGRPRGGGQDLRTLCGACFGGFLRGGTNVRAVCGRGLFRGTNRGSPRENRWKVFVETLFAALGKKKTFFFPLAIPSLEDWPGRRLGALLGAPTVVVSKGPGDLRSGAWRSHPRGWYEKNHSLGPGRFFPKGVSNSPFSSGAAVGGSGPGAVRKEAKSSGGRRVLTVSWGRSPTGAARFRGPLAGSFWTPVPPASQWGGPKTPGLSVFRCFGLGRPACS